MIKAIDTEFQGYLFRSRLEARWAVFFDALGLQWEYEPEGFDLGGAGWYLPDFYLPELRAWIEIKPKSGDQEDVFKQLVALIECGVADHCKAWGFFGDPLDHEWMMPAWYENWKPNGSKGWKNEWAGASIEFHRIEEEWQEMPGFGMQHSKNWLFKKTGIKSAIGNYAEKQKARSARFEHGATPQ